MPTVTSCIYSTSAVSQNASSVSSAAAEPSHLCLSRDILPGAKEKRVEGERDREHRAATAERRGVKSHHDSSECH